MNPSGATELIWHFAGYLRLPPADHITEPTLYDGTTARTAPHDELATRGTAGRPTPDEAGPTSSPAMQTDLPAPEDWRWDHTKPLGKQGVPTSHFASLKASPLSHPVPGAPAGGGAAGSDEYGHDAIVYRGGGDQEIVDVRQVNVLHSDDLVDLSGGSGLHVVSSAGVLQSMLDAANAAVPAEWRIAETDSTNVTKFVEARDSQAVDTHPTDLSHAVDPGQYVDRLRDPGADIHQVTTDAISNALSQVDALAAGSSGPTGDASTSHVETASLGGNVALNDTLVADYSGLTGTLVVLGDYHHSTAVVQTNVLVQDDWFGLGRGSTGSAVTFNPDTVHNVADIVEQGANVTSPWTAGGSFHWSVDVLDGSLYDVKSVTVTNFASDNDVLVQTLSVGHSEIVLGSNAQVNLGEFQNLSARYDLIIVEGSYHQANFVYQTNVVLDWNRAVLDGGKADVDGAACSVTAGGNVLLNDATVVDIGSCAFQSVDPAIADLVKSLAQHEQVDPASVQHAFPTLAGTVNALLVTGDYYDVNCVSQTNVISDANVALQVLPGGGEQHLSTGGNQAINAATVVDGGSLASPYLQGSFYNDMILVQTNLVVDKDKVVVNDPAQLVSELVAFATTDQIPVGDDALPSSGLHPQHDILAGLLH